MAVDIKNELKDIRDKIDEVSDTCHKIDKDVAVQKTSFDDHLKQDELMYSEFKRMNDILQENTSSLKEHMQQTMLLKDMVLKMDARLSPMEVKHIETNAINKWRKDRIILAAKVIGAVVALVSLGVYAKPLLIKLLLAK